MKENEQVVIRITGDSGDGMQLVGEQLTLSAALSGRDVRTLPDFPAEIRAPSGTVAGVSGFQLAMSEQTLFTAGDSLDVLVALNPAALKHSLPYLNHGGLLIINEDHFREKDWKKAGVDSHFLTESEEHYQLLSLPLISLTVQAVSSFNLSKSQAEKSKNFFILGLVSWLFDLPLDPCRDFIAGKFINQSDVAQANDKALMAGYNYALTLELSRKDYMLGKVPRESGEYRQITGVEAIGMAAATLATGCRTSLWVSGYPITPSSAILHECAKLEDYGVQMFQAEDEIAALCSCLGAAFGGKLALSCTSGPGLDLKSESLGLAVVSELPLVLIDVQRAGASTGLPTKTGQSDLSQALYGRHGESPLLVLAAKTPSDCFDILIEAFSIAVKYMTPVIVLMDAFLANAAEPWKIPDPNALSLPDIRYNRFTSPYERDDKHSRSWNIPGSPGYIHQIGGLEKAGEEGKVSYDAENHQNMVQLRAQKIQGIAADYPSIALEGDPNASLLIIAWGSTYGSVKAAVNQCLSKGLKVAYIHLRYLNPLPRDLGSIVADYNKILVAELNQAQLCQLIRAEYLVDAKPVNQCNGQPFRVSFLVDAIQSEMSHETNLSAK